MTSDSDASAGAALDEMMRVSPLVIGAAFRRGDFVGQGYVLNLSRGGLFLSTRESFAVGDELRIRFFLPFQLGRVDARAEVRWRTEDAESPPPGLGPGLGLAFVSIASDAKDLIQRFIERFCELADELENA